MSADKVYKLLMAPPVVLEMESADGKVKTRIDVYEALRMLAEAEKKPEPDRWATVNAWLASRLQVQQELLSESVAIEFNDTITAIVSTTNDERKKKALAIASSPVSIPASPTGCC